MKKLVSLVLAVALVLMMTVTCAMAEEEKPTIRVLFTKNAMAMPISEMKVVTDVEEICGVNFDVIEVPADGASEKINLMINSGDLPDVFMQGIDANTIIKMCIRDRPEPAFRRALSAHVTACAFGRISSKCFTPSVPSAR